MLATTGVAVALAAGVAGLIGSGGTDEEPPSGSSAAGAVATLGDPRTADPCGLLDAGALERFGDAELVTDYGAFDRCDVLLLDEGETVADVRLDFANDPAEPGSQVRTRRVGRVTVAEPRGGDGSCDRNLGLADGRQIWITAEREAPSAPDVCRLADAAVEHAVRRLNTGPVPRRPAAPPRDSLAHLNACRLLDPATAERATGHPLGRPDAGIGGWDCAWHGGAGGFFVEVDFDRDDGLGPDDGRPTVLAGRTAYVETGSGGSCVVRTGYRTYRNMDNRPTTELIVLTLSGPGPAARLCDRAEALGAGLAAGLPRS
ncbi:hypothetical protein IHE55_11945 [Streptomyces pactum]|uniref:DUF3558 domain-containing protein n=1 Tax=Streptomyces pactum TaxID=68249 RepID=A0ABS0NJU4_9ACTN|nr:hypothetical protein [Streptomyces pactum]MBH5335468.1 hypothetical protein [Streptomyces pactum]